MKDEDLLPLLALQATSGIGDVLAKRLLTNCGSAAAVFTEKDSALRAIEGIGNHILTSIKNVNNFTKAERELHFIRTQKINTLYFKDDAYPERLKHCFDAPVLLFSSGNWSLENKKVISIVGTRQITPQGIDFCHKLMHDLVAFDPVIVSGFAYGVDITAHLAAIQNNLQTIGVLAHGLNQTYPKVHKKYVAKVEDNGGFLTDFWSSSNPDRENFLKRNRIVAGISEATIVIESAEKGGSMVTAHIANEYNRDVFAVPGRPTDMYSQGCNRLIKTNKAHLLTDVADLVYMLNWDVENKTKKTAQKQLFVQLEPEEQKIFDYITKNGKTLLDVIAIDCEIPTYKLSSLLLTMELKDVIRPLPGKLFEVV